MSCIGQIMCNLVEIKIDLNIDLDGFGVHQIDMFVFFLSYMLV